MSSIVNIIPMWKDLQHFREIYPLAKIAAYTRVIDDRSR